MQRLVDKPTSFLQQPVLRLDHCEREVGQDTPLSEAPSPEGGGRREEGDAGAGPAKVYGPGCQAVPGRVSGRLELATGNTGNS